MHKIYIISSPDGLSWGLFSMVMTITFIAHLKSEGDALVMLAVDVYELLFCHGVTHVGFQLATWFSTAGSATSPSSTPASCRTSCTSSLTLCSLLLMQLHSVPYKHSRCDLSRSLPESCRQSCSTCTQSTVRCPTKSQCRTLPEPSISANNKDLPFSHSCTWCHDN